MTRVLLVVSRQEPGLYDHLRRTLETATVEVVFDRRRGERRQRSETPEVDLRRGNRRQHDINEDLRRLGWAQVWIE